MDTQIRNHKNFVVRRPAVAGYYYPADPTALRSAVDGFARAKARPAPALGLLVPHGSFRHCGMILGETLAQVTIPRRCIILGPSHTGSLMPWSLMVSGAYRTPLGDVPVDERCAQALLARCAFLEPDAWSQRGEHAVEVVLPFLQRLGPRDLTIVPIVTGSDNPDEFSLVAHALAQVIRMQEELVLLIASSDLSHYEPCERSRAKDQALIDAVCSLDEARLIRSVHEGKALMCGYGAAACVLSAARTLGARSGRLVRYGTSAGAGGDPHSVTGYAGIIFS